MSRELDELASQKYVSLKTFKRDGSAVATPVWIASDDTSLCIITELDSWKVKRIRNNQAVELAPCDMRGTTTGDYVPGRAELQDREGTRDVQALIRAKYGLMAALMGLYRELDSGLRRLLRRPSRDGQVGIRVYSA